MWENFQNSDFLKSAAFLVALVLLLLAWSYMLRGIVGVD